MAVYSLCLLHRLHYESHRRVLNVDVLVENEALMEGQRVHMQVGAASYLVLCWQVGVASRHECAHLGVFLRPTNVLWDAW